MAPKQKRSSARRRSRARAGPGSRAPRRSSRVSRRGTPALRGGFREVSQEIYRLYHYDDVTIALREAVTLMREDRLTALTRFGPLRTWDTSLVPCFKDVFENFAFEDQRPGGDDDITGWNTQAAITMSNMFGGCYNFNQPLEFDTRNVTDMTDMFQGCSNFNQPLEFDTRNVTDMKAMFSGCYNFNQPLEFDTLNVTDMADMFAGCSNFNQPLNFNDTRAVTNMSDMFYGCAAFNQPLNFDTSAVTDMSFMFFGCTAFNQPLNAFTHVPEVINTDMLRRMFLGCDHFQGPVFPMSLSEVTDSGLLETPLGQSDLMQETIQVASRVFRAGSVASRVRRQGRLIAQGSVAAARALGVPVQDSD